MARKYWEEMGYSTEWYYDQMRICRDRLDDAELARLISKHGEKALAEIKLLAESGNFNRYIGALDRIKDSLQRDPPVQADLFA